MSTEATDIDNNDTHTFKAPLPLLAQVLINQRSYPLIYSYMTYTNLRSYYLLLNASQTFRHFLSHNRKNMILHIPTLVNRLQKRCQSNLTIQHDQFTYRFTYHSRIRQNTYWAVVHEANHLRISSKYYLAKLQMTQNQDIDRAYQDFEALLKNIATLKVARQLYKERNLWHQKFPYNIGIAILKKAIAMSLLLLIPPFIFVKKTGLNQALYLPSIWATCFVMSLSCYALRFARKTPSLLRYTQQFINEIGVDINHLLDNHFQTHLPNDCEPILTGTPLIQQKIIELTEPPYRNALEYLSKMDTKLLTWHASTKKHTLSDRLNLSIQMILLMHSLLTVHHQHPHTPNSYIQVSNGGQTKQAQRIQILTTQNILYKSLTLSFLPPSLADNSLTTFTRSHRELENYMRSRQAPNIRWPFQHRLLAQNHEPPRNRTDAQVHST